MSVQTQINRLKANIQASLGAVTSKGVTVPSNANSDNLAGLIGNINNGAGATATAADILNGKTATVNGKTVTGSVASKSSSDLTASGATVTVPAGHYSAAASKSVATATQATPTITVDAGGLIVASATQTAGYVAAGTEHATKQLIVRGAETITPGTANKTAIEAGRYTTGSITVAGDADLIPANIVAGKNIFGVAGSAVSADNIPATQWSSKYSNMIAPTLSNTTAAITVKALTYYDGYWYGAGVDSAGDCYKLYGTTTGNLTAVKLASSRKYPVTGIACDGTNVWVCCASGAYSNRIGFFQSIANFRSTNTSYTYVANDTISWSEICRIGTSHLFIFGGQTTTNGATIGKISTGGTGWTYGTYANYVPEPLISGCDYNGAAVAVTANGHIVYQTNLTGTNISYVQRSYLQGAQMVRHMYDCVCVACVKSDGTYLYYNFGNPINTDFYGFKVTDEVLTVVGMAYANGLYTLVGYNSSGVTKVWQSTDIADHGLYGQTMALSSGYTPRVMATNGTNICILADNGSTVQKALITVS